MRRLKSDLVPILIAAADGCLADVEPPEWDRRSVVGVVAAAEGYPGSYRKGSPISGLDEAAEVHGVEVFHAGTAERAGDVVTSGGRVLCITALGETMDEARDRAYEAFDAISGTASSAGRTSAAAAHGRSRLEGATEE